VCTYSLKELVDAVSHYYGVLPDWVGDPERDQFVEDFQSLLHVMIKRD